MACTRRRVPLPASESVCRVAAIDALLPQQCSYLATPSGIRVFEIEGLGLAK